jgi:hypothetical protein
MQARHVYKTLKAAGLNYASLEARSSTAGFVYSDVATQSELDVFFWPPNEMPPTLPMTIPVPGGPSSLSTPKVKTTCAPRAVGTRLRATWHSVPELALLGTVGTGPQAPCVWREQCQTVSLRSDTGRPCETAANVATGHRRT